MYAIIFVVFEEMHELVLKLDFCIMSICWPGSISLCQHTWCESRTGTAPSYLVDLKRTEDETEDDLGHGGVGMLRRGGIWLLPQENNNVMIGLTWIL